MATVKTSIDYSLHGKAIRPRPSNEELTGSQIEWSTVTVDAEGTKTIDLNDKGTINKIYLFVLDGIEDITATVNAADEFKVEPALVLGTGITGLVLNNASTTDDWDVRVGVSFT